VYRSKRELALRPGPAISRLSDDDRAAHCTDDKRGIGRSGGDAIAAFRRPGRRQQLQPERCLERPAEHAQHDLIEQLRRRERRSAPPAIVVGDKVVLGAVGIVALKERIEAARGHGVN